MVNRAIHRNEHPREVGVTSEGDAYYAVEILPKEIGRVWEFKESAVSLPRGVVYWNEDITEHTRLFATGQNRVYLRKTDQQSERLIARDLRTGTTHYNVPYARHFSSDLKPAVVRLHGRDEAIVDFHTTQDKNGHTIDGVQILNGIDGQILQVLPCRVTNLNAKLMPRTDTDVPGEFAVLGEYRGTRWYFKIEKFKQDSQDGQFHHISTEVIDLGRWLNDPAEISIEPWRYILACSEVNRSPDINVMAISMALNPVIDQTLPANIVQGVTRWLRLELPVLLTLPRKATNNLYRRTWNPKLFTRWLNPLIIKWITPDRLVLSSVTRHQLCLFDFGERKYANLGARELVNPRTYETRC